MRPETVWFTDILPNILKSAEWIQKR